MTVKTIAEAWKTVDEIFPTDYEKDENASRAAGYDIFRSRINRYDYICDLGNRLEINLASGKTINVWICEPEIASDKLIVGAIGDYVSVIGKCFSGGEIVRFFVRPDYVLHLGEIVKYRGKEYTIIEYTAGLIKA